jgi:hypothetical protein
MTHLKILLEAEICRHLQQKWNAGLSQTKLQVKVILNPPDYKAPKHWLHYVISHTEYRKNPAGNFI